MTAKNRAHVVENDVEYELVPPDGGWGIMVALAVTVAFGTVIVPASGFGIVFGPFLANIGDEASATAVVGSMFNTILCFTGLIANHLLQKTSYRKVGVLGSVIYFVGSFSSIFVTTSTQLVVTWGVLQGLGFGLIMPAVFAAFNTYFDKKRNTTMGLAQVFVGLTNIFFPTMAKYLMSTYGFRGTVALISAYGLNCIPAMLCLQPVKWHMKKQLLVMKELKPIVELRAKPDHVIAVEEKCLLKQTDPSVNKVRRSERKLVDAWKSLAKALDLGLFKQYSYINIVIGISLSITSDLAFISIFPLLLTNVGLTSDELTYVMTLFFSADLVCRLLVSVLTALIDIPSRTLFLFGVLFSAIFRTLFVLNDSFWWIMTIATILGFLRSLIQVPLPLVIAEAFPTRFVTAFSLYMVVCGFVALAFGPLISFVKQTTQSLDMVVHLLTLAYVLCAVPWLIEMAYVKLVKK